MDHFRIEQETAEALLDVGVSAPIKEYRLPWRKRPWVLRLTMRRPYLGGQIRIAREYLKMGVKVEQVDAMSHDEQMAFIATHGHRLSRMVALTICRGYLSGIVLAPLLAYYLRHAVDPHILVACFTRFVALMGIGDFGTIIRLSQALNPMSPTLSQTTERS